MTPPHKGQPARKRTGLSEAVAAQLRAERAAARVSQALLADRAEMSRITLMRVLNGDRVMDLSQFAAICEGLGVSPAVVMARAAAERTVEGDAPAGATI